MGTCIWYVNKQISYFKLLISSLPGIFALAVLHIHLLYLRHKIDEWYDPEALESLKVLGLVVFLSSVVAFGTYLTLAIRKHQSMFNPDINLTVMKIISIVGFSGIDDVKGFSYYPAAIFAFMSMKWGFMLYWDAKQYKRYVKLCNPELIYGNRRHPGSDGDLSRTLP